MEKKIVIGADAVIDWAKKLVPESLPPTVRSLLLGLELFRGKILEITIRTRDE
jgi:hypothetical protein